MQNMYKRSEVTVCDGGGDFMWRLIRRRGLYLGILNNKALSERQWAEGCETRGWEEGEGSYGEMRGGEGVSLRGSKEVRR